MPVAGLFSFLQGNFTKKAGENMADLPPNELAELRLAIAADRKKPRLDVFHRVANVVQLRLLLDELGVRFWWKLESSPPAQTIAAEIVAHLGGIVPIDGYPSVDWRMLPHGVPPLVGNPVAVLAALRQWVETVQVEPPPRGDDPSVWVLVSQLEPPMFPSVKEHLRYIEKYAGEIRTRRPLTKAGKPHPKRLEVHLGDWVKHCHKVNSANFDALDSRSAKPITPDELTENFQKGLMARYESIRKGKRPRE